MEHDSNKGKIKYIKKKSDFTKANKIKNKLFSFAQDEIKEKKKIANEPFSFSSLKIVGENIKKLEPNLVLENNNYVKKKLSNDSSCDSSNEDNSSDLSCVEEDF